MPRWPDMDETKQCTATAKRTGERCARARVPGAAVCRMHGGAASQVVVAAARRVADAEARELAGRIGVDVPDFQSPGDAARYLLGQVHRRSAQFGELADRLESATYTDRAGQERVRAAFAEERRWLDSMSKVLSVAVQAGSAAGGSGPDPVEIFEMTAKLFMEDADSALCDVGIYGEQHEQIMDRLRGRASRRICQSEGLIIEQIRMMAEAGRAVPCG